MSRTFGAVSTTRITCGSPAVLDNLDPYTFACWFFSTSPTNPRRLAHKGLDTANRRLAIRNTGTAGMLSLTMDRATSDLTYDIPGSSYALNTWTFLGLTFNSGNSATELAKWYLGTLYTPISQITGGGKTDGAGAFASDASNDFQIGNRPSNDQAWIGPIAHVSVWSAELTLAQLERLRICTFHPALAGEFGATCVGYWRLGEGEAAEDHSGNGNHGTITGATASADPPLVALRERIVDGMPAALRAA